MDNFKQQRQNANRRTTVDGFVTRPVRTAASRVPAYPTAIPDTSTRTANQSASRPRARIDMSLPGAEPLEYRAPQIRKRTHPARHWAFKTTLVVLALIMGSSGLLFAQGFFNAQKVFKGGAKAAALQANVDPNQLKGEGDGRINVLLLGVGGKGHDGADLTDTIIVASIDPVNNTAQLLSVPRDLWVKVPKHGSMKINAAYAMGKYDALGKMDASNSNTAAVQAGFASADQTIENVLGIDIHYNMLLNFQAFRQAVDTVGGVSVNVPEDLYDKSMAWENNNNPLLAKAGLQQFDGKQALIYVRSRHSSSDFARSERQRAVILAIKAKSATLGTLSNPVKVSGLMKTFGDNVVTDVSLNDATKLYSIFKKIPDTKIGSIGLAEEPHMLVTTGRVGTQSVVLPVAGMNNYDAIQTYVRSALPDGYLVKEHAHVVVLNGGTRDATAQEKIDDLKSYGYNVSASADSTASMYPHTMLINLSGTKNPYTKHYLQQRFGVRAGTSLPDASIQKGTADFILILGSDETSSR